MKIITREEQDAAAADWSNIRDWYYYVSETGVMGGFTGDITPPKLKCQLGSPIMSGILDVIEKENATFPSYKNLQNVEAIFRQFIEGQVDPILLEITEKAAQKDLRDIAPFYRAFSKQAEQIGGMPVIVTAFSNAAQLTDFVKGGTRADGSVTVAPQRRAELSEYMFGTWPFRPMPRDVAPGG